MRFKLVQTDSLDSKSTKFFRFFFIEMNCCLLLLLL